MTFLTHLESTADGSKHAADQPQTVHDGKPLVARYDLAAVGAAVTRDALRARPETMWRFAELLPIREAQPRASLGEGRTPLLRCPRLAAQLGLQQLWIKDESQLPTGSFKARGMAVAVSRAAELGIKRLAAPTQGNAGGALAAYAARAGLECWVFMPDDTPLVNRLEVALHGGHAFLVDGLIHDCGAIVRQGIERMGWFDMSTLREPYRLEGKKTMGLELAEQLDWHLPDAIFYPTGGGTGLIGMDKAFAELQELGWLEEPRTPRFFACQSSGCAPIVSAFAAGASRGADVPTPHTIASGVRVPKALGDFLILDAVRRSGGQALAAAEERVLEWMGWAAALEGIALCPETATCIGALQECVANGTIRPDERVVVFNTGAAQKYVEALDTELPRLRRDAIDWDRVAGG